MRYSPFGHPQGKATLARKLVSLMPKHKLYIEPFCGSAIVLLNKPRAKQEIISDKNKWIVRYLKILQRLKDKDFEKLRKFKWDFDADSFERFLKRNRQAPRDPVEYVYWFRILNCGIYGRFSPWLIDDKGFVTDQAFSHLRRTSLQGSMIDPDEFIKALKSEICPRLKGVKILCADYKDIFKALSSKRNAFWFLDPPYPEPIERGGKLFSDVSSDFDFQEFVEKLKVIKGKFMLTVNQRSVSLKENWLNGLNILRIRSSSPLRPQRNERVELVITNYKIDKGVRVPQTRAEAQQELERIMGDYFMVEENGEIHPAVLEYHLRGIWYSEDVPKIKQQIQEAFGDKEKLGKLLKTPRVNAWYLLTSLDEVKRDAQKADDERVDVTKAFLLGEVSYNEYKNSLVRLVKAVRKHFTQDSNEIDSFDPKRFWNIGNVHIDFRILHPSEKFLVAWTLDNPKIVLQNLNDEIVYPLRDRFFDWKEGDQFLAQKKLPHGLYYLTHSVPGSSGVELRPTGEPGAGRGATRETAGRFIFQAWCEVVFGVQKTDYKELWLFKLSEEGFKKLLSLTPDDLKPNVKKAYKNMRSFPEKRWDLKLVPLLGMKPALMGEQEARTTARERKEKLIWMMHKPFRTDKPYILTHDKKKEEAKAKKEKIELIWNEVYLDILMDRYGLRFDTKKRYDFQAYMEIRKMDSKLRVVSGPVLIPYKKDQQGDIVRPEWIARAAITFAERYGKAKFMHSRPLNAKLVENIVLPSPLRVNGKVFPAGTWWIGFKIYDDTVWDLIEKGKIKGFSIGGTATRKKIKPSEYQKLRRLLNQAV